MEACAEKLLPSDADAYVEKWCADAGWGYDHNFCPIAVSNGRAYMANRYGMVAEIAAATGKKVILARTLLARVVDELLDT